MKVYQRLAHAFKAEGGEPCTLNGVTFTSAESWKPLAWSAYLAGRLHVQRGGKGAFVWADAGNGFVCVDPKDGRTACTLAFAPASATEISADGVMTAIGAGHAVICLP